MKGTNINYGTSTNQKVTTQTDDQKELAQKLKATGSRYLLAVEDLVSKLDELRDDRCEDAWYSKFMELDCASEIPAGFEWVTPKRTPAEGHHTVYLTSIGVKVYQNAEYKPAVYFTVSDERGRNYSSTFRTYVPDDGHNTKWFTGDETLDLQLLLRRLVDQVADTARLGDVDEDRFLCVIPREDGRGFYEDWNYDAVLDWIRDAKDPINVWVHVTPAKDEDGRNIVKVYFSYSSYKFILENGDTAESRKDDKARSVEERAKKEIAFLPDQVKRNTLAYAVFFVEDGNVFDEAVGSNGVYVRGSTLWNPKTKKVEASFDFGGGNVRKYGDVRKALKSGSLQAPVAYQKYFA